MSPEAIGWIGFHVFIFAMLALDLGVFNRKAHTIHVREALVWSGVWIGLSLLFGAGLWLWQGQEAATQYLAGYLLEKSLSVDNIFVILMIFSYFAIPPQYQHKILFWGILGALAMRASLIFLGVALIHRFHAIIYAFGALLLWAAWRMGRHQEAEIAPDRNPVVRLFKRFMPVCADVSSGKFFVRDAGRLIATPLFLCLLTIETADLAFALDSIPAIFGVSEDPFIIYTSNIFAILGLRSLYFALAGVIHRFHYFRYGLAAVLGFVGVKMLLSEIYKIPVWAALAVVVGCIGVSVAASVWFPPRTARVDSVAVEQPGDQGGD
ncbi:Inner membrane protein alx [compost metagenome]